MPASTYAKETFGNHSAPDQTTTKLLQQGEGRFSEQLTCMGAKSAAPPPAAAAAAQPEDSSENLAEALSRTNRSPPPLPSVKGVIQPCERQTRITQAAQAYHAEYASFQCAHENRSVGSAVSVIDSQPKPTSNTNVDHGAKKGTKQKKSLAPEELSSMIQSKIVQLETESTLEEEEERAMAKAIKKASRDMTQLIEGQTGSDKLEIIHSKYMDLFQEHKRLERDYGKMKRKLEQANKEKDSSKAECSKVNAQKQKMETLCRELQKENKRITEEHRRLSAFEQRKRDELSTKFESTIWEIKSKMEEDSDERRRRTEDNEMLKDKFKDFLEQYELREKHYNQMVKSREIEIQLLEAKLEQQRRVNGDENIKIAAMKGQVSSFVKTETDLRKQLSIYVEKFKQVEETLNKSNELFITFRKEMEQMTKKTRKLEKENASVRLKCERMNKNIIEMAAERTKTYKSVETAHAGKLKLENLCRALQTERNALRKRLEQLESRTPSPHKEPPPAPPPPLDQSTQHDGGGTDTSGKPDANRRRENDGTTSNDEFLEVHADDSVDQDAGDPA